MIIIMITIMSNTMPRRKTDIGDRPIQVVAWAGGVPIRRVPVALARRFAQICTAVVAETLDGEELTPLEYAVLVILNDDPDIDQSGLAARVGGDRNTSSILVAELEQRVLIERRVNVADRRAWLLRLTKRGAELHERIRPGMRADQRRILEPLAPAEREQFLDQLVRIIKANESYARPGAGRRKKSSGVRNK